MSGTLISLLDMTTYDFGNDVAQSQTITIPLVQNIDVSRWSHGALLVRVHSKDIGTGAEITLGVLPVLPSAQDPSKVFENTNALASVSIGEGTSADAELLIDDLNQPLGGYVTLKLGAEQSGQGTVNIKATISVELVLKS